MSRLGTFLPTVLSWRRKYLWDTYKTLYPQEARSMTRLSPMPKNVPFPSEQGTLESLVGYRPAIQVTREQIPIFRAMAANPTQEEIQDVALIDYFFEDVYGIQIHGGWRPPAQVPVEATFGPMTRPSAPLWGNNQFFFPPPFQGTALVGQYPAGLPWGERGKVPLIRYRRENWGFDIGKPWKDLRDSFWNAVAAENVIANYPFPSPPQDFLRQWMSGAMPMLRNLVNAKQPINPDALRSAITIDFLRRFEDIAYQVQRKMEMREESKKRTQLVKAVAGFALGAMVALIAPMVVGSVFSVVQTGLDANQQISAAQGMVKIAKQFQASDSAFSAEIERVAREINSRAAEAELTKPPTAPEAVALTEREAAYEVRVQGEVVGTVSSVDEAAKIADRKSSPGDVVEVLFQGKSLGKMVRPEQESPVAVPKEEGGFPWGILIPVALALM